MSIYLRRYLLLISNIFEITLCLIRGLVPKRYIKKFPEPFSMSSIHTDTVILITGLFIPVITKLIIKTYLSYYPKTIVFYVTWETEKSKASVLRDLNVKLIFLPDEVKSINGNTDRQIYNVSKGLEFIKKEYPLVRYVLKNRSDQIALHFDAISLLKSTLLHFSADEEKMITTSGSTGKFRFFMIGDQFQFAKIETLIDWWSVPDYQTGLKQLLNCHQVIEGLKLSGQCLKSENYIAFYNYWKQNPKHEYSLKSYINLIRQKIIVVDDESIYFRWYQNFHRQKIHQFINNYIYELPFTTQSKDRAGCNLNHLEWLEIITQNDIYTIDKYKNFSLEKWIVSTHQLDENHVTKIIDIGGQYVDR